MALEIGSNNKSARGTFARLFLQSAVVAFPLGAVMAFLIATVDCSWAKLTLPDVFVSVAGALPDGLLVVSFLFGVGGALGQGLRIVWCRLTGSQLPGDTDTELSTSAVFQIYVGIALGIAYWRYL